MAATLHLPKKPALQAKFSVPFPTTTQMTPMTQTTPKKPSTLAATQGPARLPTGPQKPEWRSVLIHPEAFERFKHLQKSQPTSPWFDLGDLVTAALDIVHAMPGAVGALHEQARANFKNRL